MRTYLDPNGRPVVFAPCAESSRALGAFVAYLAISLLVLGRVLGDLHGSVVGLYGGDQSFFAWSLGWWPDVDRASSATRC